MKLKMITPPAKEPLTLEEAKKGMKIDFDVDEDVLVPLIKQARELCEEWQGKKYVTQVLELYLDNWPKGSVEFTVCSPVQSIESIKYIDSSDAEHIVDPDIYELDNVSFVNQICLRKDKYWPGTRLKSVNGIVIRFTAGYEPKEEDLTANIPETVKQAMILQMKLLYEVYSDDSQRRIERARDILLGTSRVVPA